MKNQYITKKINFINARIDECIHELKERSYGPGIDDFVYYLVDPHYKRSIDSIPLNKLKTLLESWDIIHDGDLAGYIYQQLQCLTNRKRKGQYFTPQHIVENMLNETFSSISPGTVPVILDPACGSGQFLIRAYQYQHNLLLTMGVDENEIPDILLAEYISGMDIDPVAVAIARYNLAKITNRHQDKVNIIHGDFLFRNELQLFEKTHKSVKPDIIIGNPPWGSTMTSERKKYARREYTVSSTGINSFTLFIERAFDFTADKAVINFLVPEALLNIKSHKGCRELIYHTSSVKSISLWGDQFKQVYAPAISIMFQVTNSAKSRNENITKIYHSRHTSNSVSTLIPQKYLLRGEQSIYTIHYNRHARDTLSIINGQDIFTLKGKARFFLGVVTGNNSHHIIRRQSHTNPDPIIVGKDLAPYSIKFSNHYFNFDPQNLQQVAPQKLYKAQKKILYRFIGKRLTFAIDSKGYYMLNNVNGFIPHMDDYWPEALVSLFNSKLMQYYYEKSYFTLKVLRGNLESLPILNFSLHTRKKLKEYHDNISEAGKVDRILLEARVDELICSQYGIDLENLLDT